MNSFFTSPVVKNFSRNNSIKNYADKIIICHDVLKCQNINGRNFVTKTTYFLILPNKNQKIFIMKKYSYIP